jgi:phosphoglucosamine mutase
VKLFPQILMNVRIQSEKNWFDNAELMSVKEQIEQALGEQGRVLIRPSGTEPVVRVMVEAKDLQTAQMCAQRLVHALSAAQ